MTVSGWHRTFRGFRNRPADSAVVLVVEAGEVVGPLVHVVRYSPTGLNWGYDGAGPRDLARSLLAAVLGEEAACPVCRGTTSGCHACTDGLRPDLPDVELVRDVVARLGPTWVLREDELRAWWNEVARSGDGT